MELEERLAALLSGYPNSTLTAAARHLCLAEGAKRARPQLTYAFGEALGVPGDASLDIALAAELIHSASLLHDDVVDAGTLRRGRPTANSLYGNHAAVLSGDLLICFALQSLRNHPPASNALAVEVIAKMTHAAIFEVESRGVADLSYRSWESIALGKTGILFGFCGAASAIFAGDHQAREDLMNVGERLGVAFQLADDLADIRTDTNKNAFADIRQRNPSSLLALAAESSADFKRALGDAWAAHTTEVPQALVLSLVDQLNKCGAPERLRERLMKELVVAREVLARYASRPGISHVETWTHLLAQNAGIE